MDIQLNEVFDSEGNLPVVNLNPKLKVPQIWAIGGEESNLVARMVSYSSEGDAIKQVKLGDKYAHVILMSLSAKGTPAELKGGLGDAPIDSINTIFDTVYAQVKKMKMDAVMFRFPTKKMKGQGPIVQRVISRLVMQKTGGRFKVVPALYQFTGKHTYVLVVRKNANIEDISGMPEINPDLYTKVDSDVGDVFVSKKDGQQVTKETAIAGSIAAVEEKRSDRTVIARTRVSRRQVAASQSLSSDVILDPKKFEEYESTAAEFSKPSTANVVPEAVELKLSVESISSRNELANLGAGVAFYQLGEVFNIKIPPEQRDYERNDFAKKLETAIGDNSLTSVESMRAFIQTSLDKLEEYKGDFFDKQYKDGGWFGSQEEKEAQVTKMWNMKRTNLIKKSLQDYASYVSKKIRHITSNRTPSQYTSAEKRSIREYTGTGYSDINNMLLGRYIDKNRDILSEDEVTTAISNLDSAFKNGDRIPEGLTLWRAQTVRKPIYEAMVKNRVFYFRNFVSTSLSPIIFGGWKGNLGVAMASDNTREILTIDKTGEDAIIPSSIKNAIKLVGEESIRIMVGWAISNAHKINVVYPGSVSPHPSETEVILPRGTMFKINKITDSSYNDGIEYNNQKFIQAEVMTSDQLDESTVYDGDALLESGELIAIEDNNIDFASFVSSGVKEKINSSLGLLASMIDLNDIPERFIQG
ncbi:Alt-like RNA polymerase ADP-ribosyltransferase [Pectobacterium bacteriophage PM2]|uniref:NAD(+)--arginine ADP-ribosyltransferase n=1 Tax=Pectobacterium bacteriophage PM2 TaxID=1429794 RepID=A0A0A0Q2H0_9CAUD|nr:Alt-like RNA polymerase ADP-ribosyltransferase [Pectobacterium bacteriophage PM2]AHY25180.1 RNA polymerase-ADP-ribosyltransferase [Pectobacterium bacteriophage PM2]